MALWLELFPLEEVCFVQLKGTSGLDVKYLCSIMCVHINLYNVHVEPPISVLISCNCELMNFICSLSPSTATCNSLVCLSLESSFLLSKSRTTFCMHQK